MFDVIDDILVVVDFGKYDAPVHKAPPLREIKNGLVPHAPQRERPPLLIGGDPDVVDAALVDQLLQIKPAEPARLRSRFVAALRRFRRHKVRGNMP